MCRYLSSAFRSCRMSAVVAATLSLAGLVRPAAQGSAASSSPCSALTSVSLPNTTITSAQSVPAGAFVPPPGRGGAAAAPWTDLPAFCRVSATTKMLNSDVMFEVWLPAAGWKGDLQPAGSNYWGGSIPFGRMAGSMNPLRWTEFGTFFLAR